jgi:hypothetical protein
MARHGGILRRELLQILNISDHQSPWRGNIPKVLALHLFLYRAPIYERSTDELDGRSSRVLRFHPATNLHSVFIPWAAYEISVDDASLTEN